MPFRQYFGCRYVLWLNREIVSSEVSLIFKKEERETENGGVD